ncbi:tetratricopeptide repeat protein [Shewanella psychrotolerans]|uniref:tetratricopeptide repeat protein n=1 Tax=Shewanella psychrotolerans TaxID=2864206 RepID=UPI001C65EFC0|nr:hypothetical protein [Shewanella psychrotolerans]QYK02556.1 hypothetical protein K0I62_06300 [Shewanella psychrotolerans]
MLAVIFRHLEQDAQAESIYLYGLSVKPNNLNLLFNYQVLLTRNDRYIGADLLHNRIDNAKDPSPFRWVTLGNEHYENKGYRRALKYYNKAIELAHTYLKVMQVKQKHCTYSVTNIKLKKPLR